MENSEAFGYMSWQYNQVWCSGMALCENYFFFFLAMHVGCLLNPV